MSKDRDAILRAAEAIADGTPVEWAREGSGPRGVRKRLHHLRAIEKIASLHRSPELRGPGGPELPRPGDPVRLREAETSELPERTAITGEAAPRTWGTLQIITQIGEGGFSRVYRARDPNLETDVALKLLHRKSEGQRIEDRRFMNEARRLAKVRHPNVLVVHGVDEHDGRVGLWTDLIEGKTLEGCLRQQGPFGPHEATLIGIDLCRALAAVHGAGLVHRDIKTSNVMRETGGRIVLMDFNSVTERRPLSASPQDDAPMGTPLFMAPESCRGEEARLPSDIYSVGVVLYRLVSGRYPVEAHTYLELCEKHRRGESTPLLDVRPNLPATFVQVVQRALSSDPQHRYASAGEMERALVASLGTQPQREGTPPTPWWRRSAAVVAAGVALVAVALGIVSWPWSRPFEVSASLYRSRSNLEERLLPGSRVEPGDRLFLEVEGSTQMHVYVVNEDDVGNAFALFPIPGLDTGNPLPGGALQRLPGTREGNAQFWEVTSIGGEETFVVIASRNRLRDVEVELDRIGMAGAKDIAGDAQPALPTVRRGIGDVVGSSPTKDDRAQGSLSRLYAALPKGSDDSGGVWVWEIQLNNPE